jgi:hypothetical protein
MYLRTRADRSPSLTFNIVGWMAIVKSAYDGVMINDDTRNTFG